MSDRERSNSIIFLKKLAAGALFTVLLAVLFVQPVSAENLPDSNAVNGNLEPRDSLSLFSDSSASLRSVNDSSKLYRNTRFDQMLSEDDGSTTLKPVEIISGILIVFGLLFLSMWVLKKYMNRPGSVLASGAHVQVLHNFHLAPKKKISLVKVYDRLIILGMTDHSINTLAEITDPAEIKAIEQKIEESRKTSSPDFGSIYSNIMRRKGKESK